MTTTELGERLVKMGYRPDADGGYRLTTRGKCTIAFLPMGDTVAFSAFDPAGDMVNHDERLQPETAFYVACGIMACDNAK